MLKPTGAPRNRLLGPILQQAWLLGALGYAVAFAMGELVFPMFPHRVLTTETILIVAPIAAMGIVTLASILSLTHVMRIDPSSALEG